MIHERFTMKVAYACIFAGTVEDAVDNLVRLIAGGEGGFDEGVAAWRAALKDVLESSDDLLRLNRSGADFTAPQWRDILERVHDGLP